MSRSFAGKTALVTGASAGLGRGICPCNWPTSASRRLVLTARRADRLEELQGATLAAHPALRVDTIPADLADADAVTKLHRAIWTRAGFSPDILINNAGFGDLGTFETSDPAKIEVDARGQHRRAHAPDALGACPACCESKRGWICNVGSTAGMLPLPTFAVYAATKAYVNSFSEALRHRAARLRRQRARALPRPGRDRVRPGRLAARTANANSRRRAFSCVDKEDVVRQTLDALARGQGRLIPGLLVRIPMLLAESTPRWILRLVFNSAIRSGAAISGKERRRHRQP